MISVITAWVGVRLSCDKRDYSEGRSAVEQWSAFIAWVGMRFISDQRDYSVGRIALEQWSAGRTDSHNNHITPRHNTLGKITLKQWSARRTVSHNKHITSRHNIFVYSPWNSDQPDTQTHTIITTDTHRCLRRNSNPHSQQRAAAELHISATPGIILSEFFCFAFLSA